MSRSCLLKCSPGEARSGCCDAQGSLRSSCAGPSESSSSLQGDFSSQMDGARCLLCVGLSRRIISWGSSTDPCHRQHAVCRGRRRSLRRIVHFGKECRSSTPAVVARPSTSSIQTLSKEKRHDTTLHHHLLCTLLVLSAAEDDCVQDRHQASAEDAPLVRTVRGCCSSSSLRSSESTKRQASIPASVDDDDDDDDDVCRVTGRVQTSIRSAPRILTAGHTYIKHIERVAR